MYSLQSSYQIYKEKYKIQKFFLFLYVKLLLYVAKPIHRSSKEKNEKKNRKEEFCTNIPYLTLMKVHNKIHANSI